MCVVKRKRPGCILHMRIVQPDPIYCVLHKLRRSTLTQEPAPNDNVILFLAKMCLKLYLFRPLPFRQSFLKIFKTLNLNSSKKVLWVRKFGQTKPSIFIDDFRTQMRLQTKVSIKNSQFM